MYNAQTSVITFEEDTLLPDIPMILKRGESLKLPSNQDVWRAIKVAEQAETDWVPEMGDEDEYYDY